MSKEIWTPTGNNAQTEIDIQVEKCNFYKRNAETSLYYVTAELDLIVQSMKEIGAHLDSLRDTRSIVSMREFSILKSKYIEFKYAKVDVLSDAFHLEAEIKNWDDRINLLKSEREKLSTKILEFGIGKRKRSKNRK